MHAVELPKALAASATINRNLHLVGVSVGVQDLGGFSRYCCGFFRLKPAEAYTQTAFAGFRRCFVALRSVN